MCKRILTFSLVLVCILLISQIGAVAAAYSAADLKSCNKVYIDCNSSGAFAYGFNGGTVYSSMLLPSHINKNVSVNGKIKSITQSGSMTYALYEIDLKKKQYGIVGINMKSGSCVYYNFSNMKSLETSCFSISDGRVYFIRSDAEYNYLTIYSLSGTLESSYSFGKNIYNLFNNNSKTYAVLFDGSIYRFDNAKSTYVASVSSYASFFNAGCEWICTDNGRLVSLNGMGNNPVANYEENCVAVDNNGIFTKSGRNVRYDAGNYDIRYYSTDSEIKMILVYNGMTAVVSNNYEYSVISLTKFKKPYEEPYKIITPEFNIPDKYYVTSDGIICGIDSNTNVSDLKKEFSVDITITDSSGKAVTSGKVKTDYRLLYSDISYVIAVTGDITKEGNVKSNDISELMLFFLEKSSLDNVQKKAADYNSDGEIDNKDLVLIARKAESKL